MVTILDHWICCPGDKKKAIPTKGWHKKNGEFFCFVFTLFTTQFFDRVHDSDYHSHTSQKYK